MWKIERLDEADFGCEERLPGEPLMVLVTLESDTGEVLRFEMPENWLELQGLDEGDEWPEDLENLDLDSDVLKAQNQSKWMENYYQALEELEG